ncbi:Protein of unknown function (DUF2637) [Parafrankia irregularis]|uniref:DUF2637 domain-containing protein n=1 Tax=Parafrankia irregularis TaxID=795642 RepID=A0A0S4QNG3_9ACTN|nr:MULTISPECIES: DUF2637 domain-containing protein [Parafrankia]CUU56348.1 Protein of unknown function (DUF2637) [Parafrankia irregularis]
MSGVVDEQATTGPPRAGARSERAIRITTVIAVATVATVAAFVSYRHMRGVALQYGEDPMTATVLPFSVDGLIVAASMAMLGDRRAGRRRSWLSGGLLAAGACASLAANVLHADPTISARVIAGWPPLALLGSYELLMRQIHPDRRLATPPAQTPADPTATPALSAAPAEATGPQPAQPPTPGPAPASPPTPAPGATPASPPATATADAGTSNSSASPDGPDSPAAGGQPTAAGLSPGPGQLRSAAAAVRQPAPGRLGTRTGPAPLTGLDATDPSVKRAAIIRALDESGGSATAAVALLARWGVTVSKSWVYQVRKETRYAGLATGPLPVAVPTPRAADPGTSTGANAGAGSSGRRRGMATPGPSLTLPIR